MQNLALRFFTTPDLALMVILGRHELVPWNYEVKFPSHETDVCATMTPSPKRPLLCAQGRSGFTKWIALRTLLIVAALSEWLEGSWSFSGSVSSELTLCI